MKNRLSLLCILICCFSTVVTAADDEASYYITTLAGQASKGGVDGPGKTALFNNPYCVIFDQAGDLLVADTYNHTIRRVTKDGVATTLAGRSGVKGNADGTGAEARFAYPSGLALDSSGVIYVSDSQNSTIRRISTAGVVTTFAGTAGDPGSSDGTGSDARFRTPFGIVMSTSGFLYVADSGNNTVRKISPTGVVTTFAGLASQTGSSDGAGSDARFSNPNGLSIDAMGNLYVADAFNHTIRRITPDRVVTTFAGSADSWGSSDGIGSDARFTIPFGISVDPTGNVYVSDGNNTIRKITPAAVVTTVAGVAGEGGWSNGPGNDARFHAPWSIAANGMGTIYVADSYNSTIRAISTTGVVTTLAGIAESRGSDDGTGSGARFNRPTGVTVDDNGTIYVSDSSNNTIRKITPMGVVTTLAGTPHTITRDPVTNEYRGNFADGRGTAARFNAPLGLTVDGNGNLYVADNLNHLIRRITPSGAVTTLAGEAGVYGSNDGAGQEARFFQPADVVVDKAGTVYVADGRNYTIRRISPSGVVTTLAGSALHQGSVDGVGSNARFNYPSGIALDSHGNVIVADTYNQTIRRITPDGVVTTIAGQAGNSGSTNGTETEALLTYPSSIAVDHNDNIFVVGLNHTFRRITPEGIVTTLAGKAGSEGSSQDGVGDSVRFFSPSGVALNATGFAYITDSYNNTIRQGQLAEAPVTITQPKSLSVARGSRVQFSVTAAAVPAPTYQWQHDGQPFDGATSSSLSFTNANTTDSGDYSVVITNALGSVTSEKAKLTVTATTTPSTPPTSSGGGGGSGGGAPSVWFLGAIVTLGLGRGWLLIRNKSAA